MMSAKYVGNRNHAVCNRPFHRLPALHRGSVGRQQVDRQMSVRKLVIQIGMIFFERSHFKCQVSPVIQAQFIGHTINLNVAQTLFIDQILQAVCNIRCIRSQLLVRLIPHAMPGQIDCCTNLTLHFFTIFCERVHLFLRPFRKASPHSGKTGRKLPINLADVLVELDVIHLPPDVCFAVMEPHSPKSGHNRFLFDSHFAAHRKPLLLCAFKSLCSFAHEPALSRFSACCAGCS